MKIYDEDDDNDTSLQGIFRKDVFKILVPTRYKPQIFVYSTKFFPPEGSRSSKSCISKYKVIDCRHEVNVFIF